MNAKSPSPAPLPPSTVRRAGGFRFSLTDALVLTAATVLTVWLWRREFVLWWALPLVLGHFFLFCNVFLVRRWLEILWALSFLVNAGLHLLQGDTGWWPVAGIQLPFTVGVVTWEILSPGYHGIGSRSVGANTAKPFPSREAPPENR
ncbi:MAG: hypothetical protein IT576_02670 [Verrucomicrobiales bacterium]|nr:hypothetical protein [Verrucomicrobiales bacterium]